MPGAIRGKKGATPPRNTVGCQRNWTERGRRHHCAVGFTEKLGLFEAPGRRPVGLLDGGSHPDYPQIVRTEGK